MKHTLYFNGTILTSVDDTPIAKAVLVEDGKIRKVFYNNDYEEVKNDGETVLFDLSGRTLLPGFVDGHSHFLSNVLNLQYLNAATSPNGCADSVDTLVDSLKEQVKLPKYQNQKYLVARGYDESVYPDHRLPTRDDLDKVTDRPLAVKHVSGHNVIFNSAALEYAGITDDYTPSEDGSVVGFADGRLTGLFHENAVKDVFPEKLDDDYDVFEKNIDEAVLKYISKGVITAQDGDTSIELYRIGRRLSEEGRIPIDLLSYVSGKETEKLIKAPWDSSYENHYRVAGKSCS